MAPTRRRLAALSSALRPGAALSSAEDESLPQEIAVIVGGGPGISGACARLFAAEGMLVAIAQRTPDKPEIQEIIASSPEGRIHAYQCDAADHASVTALFQQARCRPLHSPPYPAPYD